jgi:hypothetical protein
MDLKAGKEYEVCAWKVDKSFPLWTNPIARHAIANSARDNKPLRLTSAMFQI